MANTLTGLIPELYRRLDVISKSMVGLIPAVTSDMNANEAALNQTIRSYKTREESAADLTPGQLPPNTGDTTVDYVDLSISKMRGVPIRFTGDDELRLNSGVGFQNVMGDRIEQAMRDLVDEIELDLAGLYTKASRAAEPAGTTLFDAANHKDLAAVRRMLNENGAPPMDRHLVLSNGSSAAFIGNANNTNPDSSGTSLMIEQGVLANRFGFNLRESAQIQDHTAGDAASATTDNAGYAVGATVITLASAGTGAILAGDRITFNGDTNVYVVASGDADVSGGGTITLAAPGLRQAIAASTTAITVEDSPQSNMAFTRNAIVLATRLPAIPQGGDSAAERAVITDPRSGLSFSLARYKEYKQTHWEVGIAWGFEVVKPEHLVLLID